jgi:sodium pump decarboxylase gamma subunit
MNPIMQGLQVSVLGLLITFLALGVFILVMVLLQRFFPGQEEEIEEAADPAEEIPVLTIETTDESEEGAVVAAIAAAVQHIHPSQSSQLGASLAEGKGNWWTARRADAPTGNRMDTRQRRG